MNQLIILDGSITYNDFDIDDNIPFLEQVSSYKEDILQISYGTRFILDVGWYPEADPAGYFWIRGIKDFNWQEPLISFRCRSLQELKASIEQVAAALSSQNID